MESEDKIKKIDLEKDIEGICKKYNLKFAHLFYEEDNTIIVMGNEDNLRRFLSNNEEK